MAGANVDNGCLAYLDAVRNAIGKIGYSCTTPGSSPWATASLWNA